MKGARALCRRRGSALVKCKVVGNVNASRYVADKELQLSNAVPKPVKPHVARLGELLLDGPVGKSDGDLVVTVDDGGTLGVAEVVQNLSLAGRELGSAEGAGVFRLLHGGADDRDAGGVDGDGRVDKARVAETSQVVEGAGHAASVGAREVRRVGQHGKLHVGRVKHLPTVRVGGDETEQPL